MIWTVGPNPSLSFSSYNPNHLSPYGIVEGSTSTLLSAAVDGAYIAIVKASLPSGPESEIGGRHSEDHLSDFRSSSSRFSCDVLF